MDSNFTQKFLRTKSLSESSDTSSIGGESILSMIKMEITYLTSLGLEPQIKRFFHNLEILEGFSKMENPFYSNEFI